MPEIKENYRDRQTDRPHHNCGAYRESAARRRRTESGVATAVMGIVNMATQRMRRWQKLMIVALTIIAIGATGFAQWWTLHDRKVEEVRRERHVEGLIPYTLITAWRRRSRRRKTVGPRAEPARPISSARWSRSSQAHLSPRPAAHFLGFALRSPSDCARAA
jgi:hypothetical protein